MNNEWLVLIKKQTDTSIKQRKRNPHEKLEFILNTDMETFSYNPPINFFEKGK